MKKKKKVKPRIQNNTKEESIKQMLIEFYQQEMDELTEEFSHIEEAEGTRFYLFQSIHDINKIKNMIFDLTNFYDLNFTGNEDFMHIPNISTIINNVQKYPILMASRKNELGIEEILGVATVKYEYNRCIEDNPYFPTKNEVVLSVTGILTKQPDQYEDKLKRVKGIGKALYKASINAAYKINKYNKVRMIFEVDCRNTYSVRAAENAVESINQNGHNLKLYVSGYYEIKDYNRPTFCEAPTLICEVDLNEDEMFCDKFIKFNYMNCKKDSLLIDIDNVILKNTKELNRFENIIKGKQVVYHSIVPILTNNLELDIGTTADGNNRVPTIQALDLVETKIDF